MNPPGSGESGEVSAVEEDVRTLGRLGYRQELLRRMSGFSNFAISLSIICILAGCITSFAQGFSSVGGASIGLGWPLGCLLAWCMASAMAQIASAFPTAGGLYHWATILGGRGWGWATAWFNLAGLITVLAAINVGTYEFILRFVGPQLGISPAAMSPAWAATAQLAGILVITFSQALLNHLGIRITTLLTDFSGYWILIVAALLTLAFLLSAESLDPARLVRFSNYSGEPGGNVWPESGHVAWLFLLGLLLPAYTVTGYDASAHTAEETVGAARNVPRAMVRSVVVSGLFGWVMLSAVVLAAPSMDSAAARGPEAFHWIMRSTLAPATANALSVGIAVAQYLCGLATVTSASRMAYAFARDGGLPFSSRMRRVSPAFLVPALAIWTVATLSVAFTVYTPAYSTITAASVILLYISYAVPIALGLLAYGRSWTKMGPWDVGGWYRVLAVLSVFGCALIVVVGIQPPNQKNLWVILACVPLLLLVWFLSERNRFPGPPVEMTNAEIRMPGRSNGAKEHPACSGCG